MELAELTASWIQVGFWLLLQTQIFESIYIGAT